MLFSFRSFMGLGLTFKFFIHFELTFVPAIRYGSGFIVLLFFLGLHLQHREVPRLGIELELQLLAYAAATAMPDLSHIFDLHHSLWQHQILNSLVRPRIEPASSQKLVGFLTH